MAQHVIVGAGPVGSATARRLAGAGQMVTVVSRRGSGPTHPDIALVAADATDAAILTRLATGTQAIYNCANPAYHRWQTDWPPMAAALLAAAERSGAVLVTMSNLYGYGPVDGPMTETTPLASTDSKGRVRAAMWRDALAAHEAGRLRAVEARASDFYGPEISANGHLGSQFMPRVLAGKPARVMQGDPDAPHSWTYVPDVAAALVTLATDGRAWGRAWHVPTAPPLSLREVATRTARIADVPDRAVRVLPRWAVRVGGWAVPMLRELREVAYQFDDPFVLDSTAFTSTFAVEPTPVDEGLRATVAWWRGREKVTRGRRAGAASSR